MQEYLLAGAMGLGLYYLYHRPTKVQVVEQNILKERPGHSLNAINVHEAMGPQFSGKSVQNVWQHNDKHFKDRVRPGLRSVRANQSPQGVLNDIKRTSAKAFANVGTKTNNIFDSNLNRIHQNRVTTKFQIGRAL